MPQQDTRQIKEKIMTSIRVRGPSLPVQIARETNLSPLFASAFLSELLSEKKIKLSHLRVGNSPLYLISGQEPTLEKFSQHLNNKEKEAFSLLKEKKFLKDVEQEPAIRVALRAIKDFALPFKREEEIYWRFFKVTEEEFKTEKPFQKQTPPIKKDVEEKTSKELNIFDKPIKKQIVIKKQAKKTPQKTNEKFFNKVKEFLSKRSIELMDLEGFSKDEIILKIKNNEGEQLLIAYNKKRIQEQDILKAHKKAIESKLPYMILSLGDPLKKLENLIEAIKNLSDIEKIE